MAVVTACEEDQPQIGTPFKLIPGESIKFVVSGNTTWLITRADIPQPDDRPLELLFYADEALCEVWPDVDASHTESIRAFFSMEDTRVRRGLIVVERQ